MSWALVLLIVLTIIYLGNKYLLSYWIRRKVQQVEPTFLVGNIGKLLTTKISIANFFTELYEKHRHKHIIGAYFSYKPILIVNDPEIVQDVLIRDFNVFHDRPTPGEAANTYPLAGNLFFLKGQKWRELRVKLTPTFTSGKLKLMFPIMRDCGKVLQEYVEKNIKNGNAVLDFKDLFARLTINNISSIAFGVENDCINEPENEFRKMGLKMFEPNLRNGIMHTFAFFIPDLFVKSKIDPFGSEVSNFIYSVVNQTIDFRKKNNFRRNDFIQLLIDLKDKGYVAPDNDSKNESEPNHEEKHEEGLKKLTIDEVAAQSFIFFGAGFETSSSTMTFSLFELSRNKEVQKKVQEEIDSVMKKAGPEGITYDLLNEMKYLDCCVDETLRKYPLGPIHFRETNKDYKLSGTDIVVEKGTSIFIPVMGIHRDSNVYEDPLAFKPERFLDSHNGNPKVTSGIVYMPFGDGPRNCIGSRLGKLQTKLGLAMILQQFDCELHDKSLINRELKFQPKSVPLSPIENINIKVSQRV